MNLTASEVISLQLMDELQDAPRKPRTKYGQRKALTDYERLQQTRERNREHAKFTRVRKRLFKKVGLSNTTSIV